MNKVKYKLNREWLNELLKHKTNSNVYFSLSDNDIRILLTYIDVLQSKIDKSIEYIEDNKQYAELEDYGKNGNDYVDVDGVLDILRENK